MTFARTSAPLRRSAALRIALAAAMFFANLFGQAHLAHAPAPELDACGDHCPLHVTTHSSLDDHGPCGVCTRSANFGIDTELRTPSAAREIEASAAPHSRFLPLPEPLFGSASPRGPPSA